MLIGENRYCCYLRFFRPQQFFGARRRATSVWLAEETRFPENIPPVIVLKAVGFIIQFRKKENIYILLATKLLII